jgi:hypothetical protein
MHTSQPRGWMLHQDRGQSDTLSGGGERPLAPAQARRFLRAKRAAHPSSPIARNREIPAGC